MLSRFLIGYLWICFSSLSQAQNPSLVYNPASLTDSVSKQLGIKTDTIYNTILYRTVIDWIGTRYKYGGRSKAGIDCSDFASILYKESYNIDLSGRAGDMFKKALPIGKPELKEGDLVFFKIRKVNISHIGVYLGDNKFAHATTKAGVIISDLNEPYYLRYFYKGGYIADKRFSPSHITAPIVAKLELSRLNYSKVLGFKIDSINTAKLYESVKNFLEKPVPKKSKKQKDKDGALFCAAIYAEAYTIKLEGNAMQLLNLTKPLSKEELREGDLVFFKNAGKKAAKIGIYLTKNKFVHLSAGRIVTINDLNEPVFKKTYYRGGRIIGELQTNKK